MQLTCSYTHSGARYRASAIVALPFLAFLAASPVGAFAAQFYGVIRLRGGRGIAGAQVNATCIKNTTGSDEAGAFQLPALSPGCRLSVTADGFQATVNEVKDPSLPAEIVMMLDPLRQSVTVLDSSPLISANPEISTAIDTRTRRRRCCSESAGWGLLVQVEP